MTPSAEVTRPEGSRLYDGPQEQAALLGKERERAGCTRANIWRRGPARRACLKGPHDLESTRALTEAALAPGTA